MRMFKARSRYGLDAREAVRSLYRALLAREPSGGEEADKVRHIEQGGALEDVLAWIVDSPECQLTFYRNRYFEELMAPEPLPLEVPRLYLWHVPKTGGSSLREMLKPHFGALEFLGGASLSELFKMSAYRLRSFRVICGHFGPALPQLLSEVPLVTTTLLRDPVDMVASHYAHWRDRGLETNPLTRLARELPFEDWCRSGATRGLWSNPQATSLTGTRVPPTRSEARIEPEGAVVAVPQEELLDRATAALEGMDIVGTTDDLLAVYGACLRRLDMEPSAEGPLRENTRHGIEVEVSAAAREWLLERNAIDAVLFDQARHRASQLSAGRR